MRKTAALALLEQLASDQHHVLSKWRGLILLRRASFSIPPSERRWEHLPQDPTDLTQLFSQMRQRGEINVIKGLRGLYEVTVPYAQQGILDEREILFELHPFGTLSHLSALAFHGLTDEQPKKMFVTVSSDISGGLLPMGTIPRDWEGIQGPEARKPPKVLGRPIEWIKVKPERFFGFAEYQPLGYPMRYTTIERTLIDGLQNPDLGGGISNVLRAWVQARHQIDLDVLIYQVERYNIAVLRQRVGYVLDQLKLSHSRLEEWRRSSHRGGSSRLVGAEPFASIFDENWNLSLNASVEILHENAA